MAPRVTELDPLHIFDPHCPSATSFVFRTPGAGELDKELRITRMLSEIGEMGSVQAVDWLET